MILSALLAGGAPFDGWHIKTDSGEIWGFGEVGNRLIIIYGAGDDSYIETIPITPAWLLLYALIGFAICIFIIKKRWTKSQKV